MNIGDTLVIESPKSGLVTCTVVDVIQAGVKPTEEQLLKYYDTKLGDETYEQLSQVIYLDRLVLQKPNGKFVVGPEQAIYHWRRC